MYIKCKSFAWCIYKKMNEFHAEIKFQKIKKRQQYVKLDLCMANNLTNTMLKSFWQLFFFEKASLNHTHMPKRLNLV